MRHPIIAYLMLALLLLSCQKRLDVTIQVTPMTADVIKTIALRLGVDESDVKQIGDQSNLLLVNMPAPVDTASVERLLSHRGEFELWETYRSKEITPLLVDKNKSGQPDTLTSLLVLRSDDYCILGYASEKDTATVSHLLSERITADLSDVRLLWFTHPEEFGGSYPLNDSATDTISQKHYALICLRGTKPSMSVLSLEYAKSEYEQFTGRPIVTIHMNKEDAIRWANLTKKNVGNAIAMVIDHQVYCAPNVNSEITGGLSSVSGNFTEQEAQEIALLLNSGPLNATVKIVNIK